MYHSDLKIAAEYHHGIELPSSMRLLANERSLLGGRFELVGDHMADRFDCPRLNWHTLLADRVESRFEMDRAELRPWLDRFKTLCMGTSVARPVDSVWYPVSYRNSDVQRHDLNPHEGRFRIHCQGKPGHDSRLACSVYIMIDSLDSRHVRILLSSRWH
jgi:hypothetical protein